MKEKLIENIKKNEELLKNLVTKEEHLLREIKNLEARLERQKFQLSNLKESIS